MVAPSAACSVELGTRAPARHEPGQRNGSTDICFRSADEAAFVLDVDGDSSCRTSDGSSQPDVAAGGQNRHSRRKASRLSASLAIKLTVFVGMLVTVASGVMALVFWITAKDVLDKELGPRLVTVATLRKQSLLSYIASEHNNMDLIGSRVLITQMLRRVNNGSGLTPLDVSVGIQDLYSAISTLDQYREGAIFDLDGTMVFQTNNFVNSTGAERPPAQSLNYSYGVALTFMNQGRPPGDMLILLSVQVNSSQPLGYLQCTIDAAAFRRLVYEPAGLENTGEVLMVRPAPQPNTMEFLVDPQLSHGRFEAPFTKGLFRAIFLKESGSITERDYRGIKVAAAYAPMDFADWGIEAKLNYDEAFHPIHRIRIILISCMVSVLVFGIGASYFLARLFTHRIVELNKTAAALAGGDMNARVPERKPWMKDEVSELTRTFNMMAAELASNRTTLEARVLERTRDLATANAGLALEIEERKKAEAEVVKAKDEAVTANNIKSNFLANMSHEIRTPLNGIINCTELCLDTRITPDQQEYLGLVKFSAEHLLNVINDILDFSKIEAGKMDLEKMEFSLRSQLEHAVSVLAVRARKRNVELLCDVSPDVVDRLLGDPGRLFQIFVNLIGNAIKFTPPPGVPRGQVLVTASVESTSENGDVTLRLVVEDTGIGIARDKQKFLFKAFSQVDSSTTRLYGGTGLGLVISAKLAAAMGGQMWVDSDEGNGSKFSFTAKFEPSPNQEQRRLSVDFESMENVSVLVVDDNPTSCALLERMLTSWKAAARSVPGAFEAAAALSDAARVRCPYQVLLVDLDMPDIDGLELLRMLREERPELLDGVAVVMLTPVDYGDLHELKELNVQGTCTKPVKESALLRTLHGAIGSSASPGRQATSEPRKRPAPQKKLHILVAEDNLVNQAVARALLTKWGHTLRIAPNGREAVALFKKEHFDICLMDVQMPVIDGLQATELIRAEEGTSERHIPIVAMTAHAMAGDAERCIAVGMDGYLSKPLNAEKLHALLRDYALGNSVQAIMTQDGKPDPKITRRASA